MRGANVRQAGFGLGGLVKRYSLNDPGVERSGIFGTAALNTTLLVLSSFRSIVF